jgi:hypothetical protein
MNHAAEWDALWTAYISALRNGHRAKAAELKRQIERFDSEVLGL